MGAISKWSCIKVQCIYVLEVDITWKSFVKVHGLELFCYIHVLLSKVILKCNIGNCSAMYLCMFSRRVFFVSRMYLWRLCFCFGYGWIWTTFGGWVGNYDKLIVFWWRFKSRYGTRKIEVILNCVTKAYCT